MVTYVYGFLLCIEQRNRMSVERIPIEEQYISSIKLINAHVFAMNLLIRSDLSIDRDNQVLLSQTNIIYYL